jgi:hypothetical protein
MAAAAYEPATFLNMELVVDSRVALDPLVGALTPRAMCLYHGRFRSHWRAVLEFAMPKDPDSAIRRFCRAVAGLRGAARIAWRGAKDRAFDVGIQSAHDGAPIELGVGVAATRQAAALSIRIQITVYPPVPLTVLKKKRGRARTPSNRPLQRTGATLALRALSRARR